MSRTLYIDITQLVHWEGKITGIPRVMYELATRFRSEQNAHYVSWVRQIGAYCEVDYEASVLSRQGVVYLSNAEPNDTTSHTTAPSKKTIKRVVNKAINGTKYLKSDLPDRIRDKITVKKSESYRKVTLGNTDAVFIPWGEWWDKNFLTMIVDAHTVGAKISTFVHDIGPMVAPHLAGNSASLADYCATVVPICEEVFVNSKFTRSTLESWLQSEGHAVPHITVVTLGDDFTHKAATKPTDEGFVRAGLKGDDYLLTVGTIELKKNHIFYYYVYKLANERGIELPPLVIAGRKGWATETAIATMQTDPAVKDKFIFLFNTSDEELVWLYEHAKFSIFASMYEGWGMPLAESLSYGVPVVSARSTSLVEIGDGLIDRFTQASTDECLEVIQNMLATDYLKKKRAMVKQYRPAKWDTCYADIREQLQKKEML